MKITIDRFEGDFAVVEISENCFANIPKILVPDAEEGDSVLITIESNEKKKEKEGRLHRLFNRDK